MQKGSQNGLPKALKTKSTTSNLLFEVSTPPPTPTRNMENDHKSLLYHLQTLWLFTATDMKSIVWPETAFGVFSALSGPCLTTNPSPRLEDVLLRLPRILLWIWLNLLVFDISNQRLPHSILEDQTNQKSQRPLPSGRLSADQARRLLLFVISTLVAISYLIGGLMETLAATVLTWMYNDLGGAHDGYIVRNLINAGGFVSYSAGTALLGAGIGQYELNSTANVWLTILGAIVFTTLQMQDMADMEGDAAVGRRTLPLVHGEMVARWSIAIPVIFWTWFCPAFWKLSMSGYIPIGIVGFLLAGRVLLMRTAAADRVSFKIWCLWTIVIYMLPLFKDHDSLTRFWDERILSPFFASSISVERIVAGRWSIFVTPWERMYQSVHFDTVTVMYGLVTGTIMVALGTIIYRLYFHPLAKYPGPFLAKITDWYNVYHCYIGDRHLEFAKTHDKYGKIVRYGPNCLSFCSATGLKSIYSTRANVLKSSMFEVFPHFFNSHSTFTMIDTTRGLYPQKRRVTTQALNDNSLKSIEHDTLPIVQQFCDSMRPTNDMEWSKSHNIKTVVGHLTFDVMGTVCFGKSFGMMENTNNHYIIDVLSKGAHALNTVGHMLPLLKTGIHNLLFRDLLNGLQRYKEYSKSACMTRINDGTSRTKSDVMGSILRAQDTTGNSLFSTTELISEASLLITAGSDTTSTTISSTIFYMLHFPTSLKSAQSEIRSTFNSLEDVRAGSRLSNCTYLYACITEALRMSPPVGGLLAREVCAGGMTIDGETLLEGTEVGTPIYAIHHREEYYPDPYTYLPERWLSDDEEAKARAMGCFMAFSTGPRGCVGKAMAIQECMTVLGRLLWMFDWRLKNGSTIGEGTEGLGVGVGQRGRKNEYQLYDTFTSVSDGPEVEFRARDVIIAD